MLNFKRFISLGVALLGSATMFAGAEPRPLPQLKAYEVPESWRTPVAPLQITDHVWQIGAREMTALLVKTNKGAVLIDGGMPQMADHLLANMRNLGIAPEDLKWILVSHGHADHVGPLAAIKRSTGARIAANAETALLMASGGAGDIHFGDALLYPPLNVDRYLQDGEVIRVGNLEFQVHFIPGHTPGSMAWTWRDQRQNKEVDIAYVDSLTAPGYRLLDNPGYPNIVRDFKQSFAKVRKLPCDLLLTPHPKASGWLFGEVAVRQDVINCRSYADAAQSALEKSIAKQTGNSDGTD